MQRSAHETAMRHPDQAPKYTSPPISGDEARYTAPVIPTTMLAVLAQVADEYGVAVDPWLAGLGLTRAQIDNADVRVSYRQASIIIRRARAAIPRARLGLDVGCHQSLGTFGVLGLAMITSRTFGEAMSVGIENHQVSGSMMDLELEPLDGGDVALLATPRFADDELLVFLCEELFSSSLIVCRGLLGTSFSPKRLELTYSAPVYAADYRRLFGCEIRFGAHHNRAVVDPRWLATPLPTHHPVSAQQALSLCQEQLAGIKRQSEVVTSVERILRGRLRDHPTLEQVAQSLNLSGRTLRRHLAATGHAYRDIHDSVRAKRALELLRAGALSVADIGVEIGFSDAREFRRAFKRWTGAPPRAMRTAH